MQGAELLSEFLSAVRSHVGISQAMILHGPRSINDSGYASPLYLSSIDIDVLRLLNSEFDFRRMILRDSPFVHAELLASDTPFNSAIAPLVSRGLHHVYTYELLADSKSRKFLLALDARSAPVQSHQLDILELLVAVVSRIMVTQASIESSATRAAELDHALTSRVVIEQAKGILAERIRVAPDEAFSHLRKMARDTRVGLTATAAQVVQSCTRPTHMRMSSVTTPPGGNTGGHDVAV